MEWIWTYRTPHRAAEVAELLTRQNQVGRQALGYPPRRFLARGYEVWAEPLGL